jgi:Protein of unknown function (DUF2752)
MSTTAQPAAGGRPPPSDGAPGTPEGGPSHGNLVRAWRPRSAPEQLAVAGLGAAGAAVAYQAALGGEGLWLPCPLRTLTGIPCPLCGMTTAATALAAGDLGGAMAANPFALLLAGFTLVMAVVMAARAIGRLGPPAQWPAARRRQSHRVAGVLAAASWAFQLHRFGWV